MIDALIYDYVILPIVRIMSVGGRYSDIFTFRLLVIDVTLLQGVADAIANANGW